MLETLLERVSLHTVSKGDEGESPQVISKLSQEPSAISDLRCGKWTEGSGRLLQGPAPAHSSTLYSVCSNSILKPVGMDFQTCI